VLKVNQLSLEICTIESAKNSIMSTK